jgi:hypothetical protein
LGFDQSVARVHKIFLSIGLAALVLGGSVAILPSLLWGDHADYSHVVSIKNAPGYQDPVLLEKAWALPVAELYRAHIEFQQNASVCGPTSIANVLHSLHRSADQASILEGTGIPTVMGYLPGGVTLDQLAAIANLKVGGRIHLLRDLSDARRRCRRAVRA